ncbi:MAG: putative ABC transport system permease protein [Verrucomicrobiales bacterium]|jgi:putative ABC transport system permease protein
MTGWRWLFIMAWRDSRRSRRRLLLFSSPLIFGVAALVAIQSLRDNINDSIDDQSKSLLGADLLLSSRRPFTDDAAALLKEIGGEQVQEIAFSTMAYSKKADAARLVQLRAVGPGFPHFDTIKTEPASAWSSYLKPGTSVIEQSLAEQFGTRPGDTLKVGDLETTIAGTLVSSPPRASYFAAFSPQMLIPLAEMEKTGLITERSLVFYRYYIRFTDGTDPDAVAKKLENRFKAARLSWQSPEKRRRDIGKQLDRLYRFLNLVSLASVILGGIGISSAIHQHVSRRLRSIAILRCLGATARDAFSIYLIQAIALGLLGCLGGALLGVSIQAGLPAIISKVTPLDIAFRISPSAIFMASSLSLLICVSFALLPLLKIRHVPPLAAIRAALLQTRGKGCEPWTWAIASGLVLSIAGFSVWQQGWHPRAFGMTGGLIGVFVLLYLFAKLTVILSKRFVRPSWPFTLRQGLSNLHRPNNQTIAVMVALGLGVFLIVTLILIQNLLLYQLRNERLAENGNLVLVDVQPDQAEDVQALLRQENIKIIQTAPMISMRIEAIKGQSVQELVKDPDSDVPGWVLRRDFRSTYRADLSDSEELVKGQWVSRVENFDIESAVPVSLEEGIAKDLQLGIGDTFVMDVQGLPLTMKVTNLRKVDWGSLGLNFFMVFPEGVFEEVLAFNVYTAFVEDATASGRLQTKLTTEFPNISVIDLTLIITALQDILDKVSLAIRFMAGFTILTGILILIAALISGRSERLQQMAFLRTLGASNGQIWRILSSEYAALGFLASLVAVGLALLAFWPMAIFVFDAPLRINVSVVGLAILLSSAVTLLLGLLLSRGITSIPPLEVIRQQDIA